MNDAKDSILEAIKKNKPQGEFLYPGVPIFSKSEKNILEEFKENLELGAGKWVSAGSLEEAKTLIKERYPDVKIVCSATPEIKGNKDLNSIASPHDLNDVDLGIIRAEFGVSENGMVYMAEKDMQVTALGFLSQHLVILLNPANLVRDMYEAYTKVNLQSNNYGCFMLGPSATADIGAVMVRGAQGARTLTVVFIPETNESVTI